MVTTSCCPCSFLFDEHEGREERSEVEGWFDDDDRRYKVVSCQWNGGVMVVCVVTL